MIVGIVVEIVRNFYRNETLEKISVARKAGVPTAMAPMAHVDALTDIISVLPGFIILMSLAVAIFYHGTLDPRTAIRRSTVIGALGLLGPFLFAAIEQVVSSVFTTRLHLPSNAGSIIAGGTLALAFGPMHRRIQQFVESKFGATKATTSPEPHDGLLAPPSA
jgi:hypothetical protein